MVTDTVPQQTLQANTLPKTDGTDVMMETTQKALRP